MNKRILTLTFFLGLAILASIGSSLQNSRFLGVYVYGTNSTSGMIEVTNATGVYVNYETSNTGLVVKRYLKDGATMFDETFVPAGEGEMVINDGSGDPIYTLHSDGFVEYANSLTIDGADGLTTPLINVNGNFTLDDSAGGNATFNSVVVANGGNFNNGNVTGIGYSLGGTNDAVNVQYFSDQLSGITAINIPNTYYVRTNGVIGSRDNFNTPYPSLYAAMQDAISDRGSSTNLFLIDIGAGQFNMSTNCVATADNVVIRGAGMGATHLYYYGDEHQQGPAIACNSNLWITDLTIECPTNIPNSNYTCIGALSDRNQGFIGTTYVERCQLIAGQHAFQLSGTSQAPSAIIARNCILFAPNAPSQVIHTNSTIKIYNSQLYALGSEPTGRGFDCGLQTFGGRHEIYNSSIVVRATSTNAYGLTTALPGSAINGPFTNVVINCGFDVSSSGTNSTVADFCISTNTCTNILVINYRYDGNPLVLTITNMASLSIPSKLILTNWVAGQVYSNTFATMLRVNANATAKYGGVAGRAVADVRVVGSITNTYSFYTLLTSLTATNQFVITADVPPNATFSFNTNLSGGAGDVSTIDSGWYVIP